MPLIVEVWFLHLTTCLIKTSFVAKNENLRPCSSLRDKHTDGRTDGRTTYNECQFLVTISDKLSTDVSFTTIVSNVQSFDYSLSINVQCERISTNISILKTKSL
jgi:hypothetical protein